MLDIKGNFPNGSQVPLTSEEMNWAIGNNYVIPAFENGEVDLDKLLDYADVELLWYIPSLEALKFFNFMRLVIGKEPENTNSKAHYFFVDCVFHQDTVKPYFDVRNLDYDDMQNSTLLLSTREWAKSVIVTFLIFYMATKTEVPNFGKVNFLLYVSDKMEGNVKSTMITMEELFLSSSYLQSKFEEYTFTDKYIILIRKPITGQEIKTYNEHINSGGTMKTVPLRYERRFKLQGIGSSGGRGDSALDSTIYLDDRKTTVKDVKIGDMIAMPNGKFSKVIGKSKIFYNDTYKMIYNDNRSFTIGKNHINPIYLKIGKYYTQVNIYTEELYDLFINTNIDIYIKHTEPVEYSKKDLPLDPYMLGLSNSDIPDIYLYGSIEQRKALLVGLLKSRDTYTKKKANIVVELARSLGYRATISHKDKLYKVYISKNNKYEKLIDIIKVKTQPTQCITIQDRNGEYLTNSYLPTHNSRDVLQRPQGVFFDDLVRNEKDVKSPTILEGIESTIETDVGKSLSNEGNFKVIIGTAYSENDPVVRRIKLGEYLPVVFPKGVPVPHDGIYDKNNNVIEPPVTKEIFKSVWNSRFPFYKQKKEWRIARKAELRGDPSKMRSLLQENYCRLSSSSLQLIKIEDIGFVDTYKLLKENKNINFVITTDMANTTNVTSDDGGVFLYILDANKNIYLHKMYLNKYGKDKLYEFIYQLDIHYCLDNFKKRPEISIEIDGQQDMHIDLLDAYYKKVSNGRFLPIYAKERIVGSNKVKTYTGIRNRNFGDKHTRIVNFAEQFVVSGRFYINNYFLKNYYEDYNILMKELKFTTKSAILATDNGLDCLSMLSGVSLFFPTQYDIKQSSEVEYSITQVNNYENNIYQNYTIDY